MKSYSLIKTVIRDKAKSTLFKALGNSFLIQKRIKYLSINKYLTILNLHKINFHPTIKLLFNIHSK